MHKNILTGSVIVILAAGLMGCGQGFKSGNVASSAKQDANIDIELAKAEQANADAQTAMNEATLALNAIQDENGKINLKLFLKGPAGEVQTEGLLSPVVDKLRLTFDKVFAKVDLVKEKFAAARAALMAALAKLDHTNPAQAAMIDQIMTQMGKIDAMENQFRVGMVSLAGKLDLAVTSLDKIVSGLTSFIPGWGLVVNFAIDFFVMSDIKDFIMEIKMRLLTL